MLLIRNSALVEQALKVLAKLQNEVDGRPGYPERVVHAAQLWGRKQSTAERKAAFSAVRSTLAGMCIGAVRCAYCEDSLADEVEHIYPKNLFPELTFQWANYAFVCGPCNGPKSNRYGVLRDGVVVEVVRRRGGPVIPPPAGISAFIDPRVEDPTGLLELDLGGVTPDGQELDPTFEFLPREGLLGGDAARAVYTIEVLNLNREVIRMARANAFSGFRARLREYSDRRSNGASAQELTRLRDDLINCPHLTVLHEMRRQRHLLPGIDALFDSAPEAVAWPLIK